MPTEEAVKELSRSTQHRSSRHSRASGNPEISVACPGPPLSRGRRFGGPVAFLHTLFRGGDEGKAAGVVRLVGTTSARSSPARLNDPDQRVAVEHRHPFEAMSVPSAARP